MEPEDAAVRGDGAARLEEINRGLQAAVERVTAEEIEGYWAQLPGSLKDLVSVEGRVSPDLLAYIAEDDQDRENLVIEHGCARAGVEDRATVLEALQLAAEGAVARLRRNRVAKRTAQMAVDLSRADRAKKQREAGELLEGEQPTLQWLEKHSGAILLPRQRRSTDPDLEEATADTVKVREQQKWEVEANRIVELLQDHEELPVVQSAMESRNPQEDMRAVVGSCRASTLRKRIREWRKYLTWLEIVHEVKWPRRRAHAMDYLVELQSFARATTLAFFERAAGIKGEASIASYVAFKRVLDQVNKDMDTKRPEKKQAPLLPIKVIAAMELPAGPMTCRAYL